MRPSLTQEAQQLPDPVRMEDLVGRDQSDTPIAGHVTEAMLNLVVMTETPRSYSSMIEPFSPAGNVPC